jgi:hypothetical protein
MGQLRVDRTLNADAGRADAITEIMAEELMGRETRTGSRGDGRNDAVFLVLDFSEKVWGSQNSDRLVGHSQPPPAWFHIDARSDVVSFKPI